MKIENFKKLFLNLPPYMAISIVPFLSLGPAIPDLFVSILSILTIIYLVKKKITIDKNLKLFLIFFFIVYFYINLNSIFFSSHQIRSLIVTLPYVRYILFSIFIFYLINNKSSFLKKFEYILKITIILIGIDGIFQYYFGYNFLGYELLHVSRASSIFKDELILGGYLAKLLPLYLAIIFYLKKKINPQSIVIIAIVFFGILVAGERSALLQITIFFFIFFIFANFSLKKKFCLIILFISCLFSLIFSNHEIKKRMIDTTLNSILISKNDSYYPKYVFSYGHQKHLEFAYRLYTKKPFTGHGTKTFIFNCHNVKKHPKEFGCSSHPHNTYAQVLYEFGLIGLFALFAFYIYLIFKIFRNYLNRENIKNYHSILILLSFIISVLFPFNTSGNFFHNWTHIMYFLPFGFYLKFNQEN